MRSGIMLEMQPFVLALLHLLRDRIHFRSIRSAIPAQLLRADQTRKIHADWP